MRGLPPFARWLLLACAVLPLALSARAAEDPTDPFRPENLAAWCIVPFDSAKRGPEERAAMLEKLGIKRLAYDYRGEHVPTFDAEMEALKKHGRELSAWWFPGALNDEARHILEVIQRHGVHPQLWISGGGKMPANAVEQAELVAKEADRIRPIAVEAKKRGLQVALYNHGGWFGEPENQLAIIAALGLDNVGIVYNFHHAHEHIARFHDLWHRMLPKVIALNLNGMDLPGRPGFSKIKPLGQGSEELAMLRIIRDSGWNGPVGLLNHRTDQDAEVGLRGNLEGLQKLRAELAKDFITIPAAKASELTPANGWPAPESYREWTRSLGGPTSNRFSALTQITRDNVAQLEPAWTYHSKDGKGNVQCNPIAVGDTLYLPTAGRAVVALNAATGEERWRYVPEKQGERLEDAPARRGLLYWPGTAEAPARIIFACGTYIYALDPKTGAPIAAFGQQGRTPLPTAGTAGGAVYKNILIYPGYQGDVFGYDVATGKELWRFHTTAQPGEFGGDTWVGREAGANCWGGMALDESRGIAYVSTGSPKPNFIGLGHQGANLFSNCVLALKAETGERLWHFQEIEHDIWDLDIPAAPNLVTVKRDGQLVDAVAQVTKIGNTLILDRVTGKPLFPFRKKRAPKSPLEGEGTAEYQPFAELPEPFTRQVFTRADITERNLGATASVEMLTSRARFGWFQGFAEARPTIFYGLHGGAEWTGAAVDPTSQRLYVTSNHLPWMVTIFRDDDPTPAVPQTAGEQNYLLFCASCHGTDRKGVGMAPPLRGLRHRYEEAAIKDLLRTGRNAMPPQTHLSPEVQQDIINFLLVKDRPIPPPDPTKPPKYSFGGYQKVLDAEGYPGCKPPWGLLNCLDLNTGKLLWRVPLGEHPELTAQGLPKTGTENFGGAMVTAGGLVFASGTRDKKIRAFDSTTGAELWSATMELHGTAQPATYEVDGRQYIVVAATGGGKLGGDRGDAWCAFALPKK